MTADDLTRLRDEVAATLDRHLSDSEFESGCRLACGYDGDDRTAHLADALLPLLARKIAEARGESLDVAAALLGRVADYWDGRPTQHHGHHIEADLRDVLRAIERDRDHNRAALAEPTGPEGER